MSDQPADGSLPELTPEQESDVRRLLADARHDDPIPDDVATRLDAVLAGLTRDEPGSTGIAPVVDLAARRRRRNAAALLAGAAAVIVAGFAVGQVIDVGGTADDAGSSAQVDSSRGSGDAGGAGDDTAPESATGGSTASAPLDGAETPLRLRSGQLQSDITDQLSATGYTAGSSRAPDAKAFAEVGCPLPASPAQKYGLGALYPALFDGTPAVLALRPADGASQQADVLDCATADSLASVTVPTR